MPRLSPQEWQWGCEPVYTSGDLAGIPKTAWMYPLKTSQPRQTVYLRTEQLNLAPVQSLTSLLIRCEMKGFC